MRLRDRVELIQLANLAFPMNSAELLPDEIMIRGSIFWLLQKVAFFLIEQMLCDFEPALVCIRREEWNVRDVFALFDSISANGIGYEVLYYCFRVQIVPMCGIDRPKIVLTIHLLNFSYGRWIEKPLSFFFGKGSCGSTFSSTFSLCPIFSNLALFSTILSFWNQWVPLLFSGLKWSGAKQCLGTLNKLRLYWAARPRRTLIWLWKRLMTVE